MEPPCFGRRNRNFMLCSVIGPFFSSISRFPGLADQSAAIVRVFAAFICICNLAIWWKGGVTSGSRILANLALFFFSCSCFLIHQSSIFTCVLWFVHASLVIAYVLVYHTMTLLGTSLVPHMCFLAVCLLCGGALRLFHQSGTVPVDSTGILYVTLLCVIGGALLVNAASSLDQVRCAIDALRSTCALIWRRFCLHPSVSRHTARSTEIEACELNVIGKIEETADMPVACDVLSATAPPVCKNQIALREEGYAVQVAKISRMIQSALRTGATGLRAPSDAGNLPNAAGPISHHAMNLESVDATVDLPVNLTDVVLDVFETNELVDVEAFLSVGANVDIVVAGDPMAALEELEQDAMCDCLMYSDSESGD